MDLDWEHLYHAHASELLRYLVKLTRDMEKASELMQETFLRGMRERPVFEHPASARAWLFRVGTNLARNDLRRASVLRFVPFSGRELGETGAFDSDAEQVRTALRSIPFEQATTLLLHYQSGFDRSDIAAMHGISEETVKSRLARGRKNFMAAYRRLERGLAR